jgi:hypothetical protein
MAYAQAHSSITDAPPAVSADSALESLDRETKEALAALYKAPRGVAELTIATFGYWLRTTLMNLGVIESFDTDEAKEHAAEVVITPFGREVMKACAEKYGQSDDADEAQELERTRERYFEAQKAGEPFYG